MKEASESKPGASENARSDEYQRYVLGKTQAPAEDGIRPSWMPDGLFPHQMALVEWSLARARAAIFADCGLGKTAMQLVWAENVVRATNGRVLVLTPLAVASQTIEEGRRIGVEVKRGQVAGPGVYVANYQRLSHCDPADFVGVACDESSILKSFDGTTSAAVVVFLRKMRFRSLWTATPSPNDTIELGTSSEALGYLGYMDMLGKFFRNNRNNSATGRMGETAAQWRFRGHAEKPFWRWVASWARCIRRPSDLGFSDATFTLPELREREHIVKAVKPREGMLFAVPAVGLQEEREERRRTIQERCETAAALATHTSPVVCWAQLNAEADLLEQIIPGAVQVAGSDSDDEKEEKFGAFSSGQIRALVTKPVIGAWGLNWQHCAHMTAFATHSFEQHYQSVRRLWRFGQKREVVVDHIVSDGEARVLRNLQRKVEKADALFNEVTAHMRDEMHIETMRKFGKEQEVPSWL